MATRRKPRHHEARLSFEALSIEGGVLSPEWLGRVAQLEAGAQSEADYGIPKGLNLRDEIGRYWRIARAHWAEFSTGLESHSAAGALSKRLVTALFSDALGFGSLQESEPLEIAGRTFPIGFSAINGRVPVVIAPAGAGLDAASPSFGEPGRRRSAFGLAQEYLNSADGALWGIATDGLVLRILRDNASLTRPAWIEVDLSRIFTGEGSFAEFTAFWLLAHESRFGRADQPAASCALESWREAGREEGTRAREHLRGGVEVALRDLGTGFLSHPSNVALRTALADGTLSTTAYFQELLRLVYRLIFLLTVEERGLLHPDGTPTETRALYADGYGLKRLRERAARRSAHDRFPDLWEGLKIVFRGLAGGEPRLGLPALAGIFAPDRCPDFDTAKLENRALLGALFRLAWLKEQSGLSRVNWRDMGPEEMGSVYESLLELVPQVVGGGRVFGFATGGEAKGNARKTTGSYYTPDSLVQLLLQSALEPVIADTIAAHPADAVEALLNLSIVDPACGSGHFLLAAARRLAGHVARLQVGGTPSAAEYRHALRQVVGKCLYGVDLNPMAVELCKVSLWMEAVEPGKPLSFLDSHIQLGNALLGTTPALMKQGVPDEAWDPIDGDDKKVAGALKKRNKKAGEGQRGLDLGFSTGAETEPAKVTRAVTALELIPDSDLASLARKSSEWREVLDSEAYRHQKFIADAWCAAFVWPKQPGPLADAAPTNDLWRQFRDVQAEPSTLTASTVTQLSIQYAFFQWHLSFPQVFERGGFDVVLGNPPWDSVRFSEEEFFAASRPDIATAPTAAARKRLIAELVSEDVRLYGAFRQAARVTAGINSFVRSGIRYPLCGVGRVNLFALFAEAARQLVSENGRVGQILPSGIVSDDSTKLFFQSIVESNQLVSFFDFENRERLFPAVDSRVKFGVLTLSGGPRSFSPAEFVFFATRVDQVSDPDRLFTLTAEEIALLNPATRTCPVFRSLRDARLTKSVYERLPVLLNAGWRLELKRLINQSDDSGAFESSGGEGRLALYEGKHFNLFDHRWMTSSADGDREATDLDRADPWFSISPRYWYPEIEAQRRFATSWKHPWALVWRDITNATNERTVIAAVVPTIAISNTAKVVFPDETHVHALPALIGNLGAFVFDYVARQKIGGTHMSTFIIEQLPLLPIAWNSTRVSWAPNESLEVWLSHRVLELTYTAWDMESFARDVGFESAPFRWNDERRPILRAELDAAFFHLYGVSRDDTSYVMDTFPIVKKNDEKLYGEYRTKRLVLEIYDALAEAVRQGRPYQTRLDPPPADPRVAHPPRGAASKARPS